MRTGFLGRRVGQAADKPRRPTIYLNTWWAGARVARQSHPGLRKSYVDLGDLLIRLLVRHHGWHMSEGFCRNAAQCESLGHRPRKRAISSRKALKGREEETRSFRPVGAGDIRCAFSQGVALGCHMVCLWHGTLGVPSLSSDNCFSLTATTRKSRLGGIFWGVIGGRNDN